MAGGELPVEQILQENTPIRNPQGSVSEALAAVRAEAAKASPVRFPGEDGGRSLAEMAQRDLDAALQLLADRAQYITGASGAAIALRRAGRNDMLCRASTGSNAPELGALLSTEFGLSGESVRTGQVLRCDDAERDARVNREVCRELGIASVVVMPVVNDDEVLGVFELFSGKANAFGERDLSAVQRLSEMVETAVRLAQAAVRLPEQLKETESAAGVADLKSSKILDDEILEEALPQHAVKQTAPEAAGAQSAKVERATTAPEAAKAVTLQTVAPAKISAPQVLPKEGSGEPVTSPTADSTKKKLFWSAALNPVADAAKGAEADQSHVPPVLRGLSKCEACGFPISAGRKLCVECEEKKWRGQLRVPQAATVQPPAVAPVVAPVTSAAQPEVPKVELPKPEAQAFAAAAPERTAVPPISTSILLPRPQSVAAATAAPQVQAPIQTPPALEAKEAEVDVVQEAEPLPSIEVTESVPVPETASLDVVFSGGLESSQSWLSRNKYILGVLIVIAGAAAAVYFLR